LPDACCRRLEPKDDPAKDEAGKTNDDEEDDPLDAFMAGIDSQVQQEAEKPSEERVMALELYRVTIRAKLNKSCI
jgi:hypothetical protein